MGHKNRGVMPQKSNHPHDQRQRTIVATVSRGGRLRIPREVIDRLQLADGEQIAFHFPEGKDVALVAPVSTLVAPPSLAD
jgi:hypothetical protein